MKKWRRPSIGDLKLNVDASIFNSADVFSVGMVMRDYQGRFLGGKMMKFTGRVSVAEAELTGILEALRWTSVFTGPKLIIEGDSLSCVKAINKPDINYLELGDLIVQCRDILCSRGFIRKQANRLAHSLAGLPCMPNGFNVLSSPLFLLDNLM
ncbi:hypothetical protein AgCh_026789 [Apium graveolens]